MKVYIDINEVLSAILDAEDICVVYKSPEAEDEIFTFDNEEEASVFWNEHFNN